MQESDVKAARMQHESNMDRPDLNESVLELHLGDPHAAPGVPDRVSNPVLHACGRPYEGGILHEGLGFGCHAPVRDHAVRALPPSLCLGQYMLRSWAGGSIHSVAHI